MLAVSGINNMLQSFNVLMAAITLELRAHLITFTAALLH